MSGTAGPVRGGESGSHFGVALSPTLPVLMERELQARAAQQVPLPMNAVVEAFSYPLVGVLFGFSFLFGSSEESVGELRLGQLAKRVI